MLAVHHCGSLRARIVLDPRKGVAVVILAPLLWLGWPCAAPPPPLLRALRPIPFGVGVICDFFFFSGHVLSNLTQECELENAPCTWFDLRGELSLQRNSYSRYL